MKFLLAAIALATFALQAAQAETVRFQASDGVAVTAEFQAPAAGYSTIIVLFHQARSSRGEYAQIADRLNAMGYATLAVDQRSGGQANGVRNQTVAELGGSTGFAQAIPDLIAAAAWARQQPGARTVGVLGSSYSSSLVLVLAGRDPTFADAVMSFSPGEYFGTPNFVSSEVGRIQVPVFLTAARNETDQWRPFEQRINSVVTGFVPRGAGRHGASALDSSDGAEYWAALAQFLSQHLPAG